MSAWVKNTGAVAGSEVVQLYVRDVESSVPRPPKELKGFVKLALAPGDAQTVTFTLEGRVFAFYDPDKKRWTVEPGELENLVGARRGIY